MVEFALVLPLLLLLLCGIIDFGWIFGNQLMADNACREAARFTAIHYYDSSTDDDLAIAAQIVSDKASYLDSIVTMTVSAFGDVTVRVSGKIDVLTPFLSAAFPDGKCTINAESVMRLE
jgi:Flp pilus assembly protein TadG